MSNRPIVPLRPSDPDATLRPTSRDNVRVRAAALPFLAPPVLPDEIGRLGPYRVLKIIGQGTMGMVLQGEDPSLNRSVALKVMQPDVAVRPDARERFLREARTAGILQHDNIVPIYHVGDDQGVLYLVMPMLKGMTLDTYLRKGKPLSLGQVLRVAKDVARGLAAAHAGGLIHRDIKPANLWVDASANGRIKILDFGLSKPTQSDMQLTATGVVVGTPAYMSPEQINGKPEPRSDLYSLGAVLYRLLSKKLPFAQTDPLDLMVAVATQEPAPLSQVAPQVPAEIANLVMRLLAKSPQDRPASAQALIDELKRIGRGGSGQGEVSMITVPDEEEADTPTETIRRTSPPVVPSQRRRRRPVRPWWHLAVLVGGAALLLIAMLIVAISMLPRTTTNEVQKPQEPAKQELVFVDLFSDRTLKNWDARGPKAPDALWVLQDDVLRGTSRHPKDRGILATKSVYGNFEVKLDWMLPLGGESGLLLRHTSMSPPQRASDGIEVDLIDETNNKTGKPRCGGIGRQLAPLCEAYRGAGQWNQLCARCVGDRVQVWLNENKVIDTQGQGRIVDLPAQGTIGLHAKGTGVQFRNVKVREVK